MNRRRIRSGQVPRAEHHEYRKGYDEGYREAEKWGFWWSFGSCLVGAAVALILRAYWF